MREILYRNPIVSALIINIFSLVAYMFLIKEGNFMVSMFFVFIGIANKKIIDNSINISKKKNM